MARAPKRPPRGSTPPPSTAAEPRVVSARRREAAGLARTMAAALQGHALVLENPDFEDAWVSRHVLQVMAAAKDMGGHAVETMVAMRVVDLLCRGGQIVDEGGDPSDVARRLKGDLQQQFPSSTERLSSVDLVEALLAWTKSGGNQKQWPATWDLLFRIGLRAGTDGPGRTTPAERLSKEWFRWRRDRPSGRAASRNRRRQE